MGNTMVKSEVRSKNPSGFTVLELLIVVVSAGILVALVLLFRG